MKKGFAKEVRLLVHEKGAKAIDDLIVPYWEHSGILPEWVKEFAKKYNILPKIAMQKLVHYRNCWEYQLWKVQQK